jgi:hypothetical protein
MKGRVGVNPHEMTLEEAAEMRAQQRAEEANIKILGVEVGRVRVACKECGTKWSSKLTAGGRLPLGWWKCPNGCNHKGRK